MNPLRSILLSSFLTLTIFGSAQAQTTDTTPIKMISAPEPVFPAEAKHFIYGDTIAVHVKVDKTGKVTETLSYGPLAPCSDLKDKTAAAIAKAAVEAAQSTVFEPVLQDGKPTDARLAITYKLPIENPAIRDDEKQRRKALSLPPPKYLFAAKENNIQGEIELSGCR